MPLLSIHVTVENCTGNPKIHIDKASLRDVSSEPSIGDNMTLGSGLVYVPDNLCTSVTIHLSFLTNRTGAPHGDELGLIKPLLESGTDNQEKDEKQSQNDKTGLGMEKTVKDKAKSKPESQSSQKVNKKVNWSKSKSTQVNPEAKVKEI
ncbi:hypothetical protein Tco_1018337 [Tanacetum coccineum]|uniref:Uncharacterized protein n=1 Tax=Tanacetum coccineum TaxID=301880 RepID=A0ABQ5FU25_9ASTR